MKLTAKVVLHARRREDGTHQVRLRLTKDRVAAFLDAGFAVAPHHWNDKPTAHLKSEWVRATGPNAASRNNDLRQLLNDADETGRRNPLLSAADVRDLLAASLGKPRVKKEKRREDGAPTDFVAFAEWYVALRARTDKPNTVKFYREAATSLRKWRGELPLPLAALAADDLAALHLWLLSQPRIFAGTARDRMVKLSTIARRAEKLGLIPPGRNPFTDFELPKVGNKNPPARPTPEAMRSVLELDLDAVVFDFHIHKNFKRDLAVRRDIWHLQYLIRGSRCGDVLQLRERDVRPDRISFAETKTGKLKNVVRSPAINAILARYPATGDALAYVFPVLDHRKPYAAPHADLAHQAVLSEEIRLNVQWVSDGLKWFARHLGLPAFTSHSARHMYTERAYAKTKDLRLVRDMLNHSDIGTTERYLMTLGYDALDAATESILSDD